MASDDVTVVGLIRDRFETACVSHQASSMSNPPLLRRVEMLEDAFDRLSRLPERVDALEASLTARIETFESSLSARIDAVESRLSGRIDELDSRVSTRIDSLSLRVDTLEASLRHEIRSGDEETRRFMRVLHEDLVERITLLGGR